MSTCAMSACQLRASLSAALQSHPALPEKFVDDASQLNGLLDKLDQVSEISARQSGAVQVAAQQLVQQTLEHVSTLVGAPELGALLRTYVAQRSSMPEIVRASNSLDVFICHSSADKAAAMQLAVDISRRGFPVWLKGWEMAAEASLHDRLTEAVSESYWFVVLLSPDAVAQDWCQSELQALLEEDCQGRVLVLPVLLQDCQLPNFLDNSPLTDCRGSRYAAGLQSILERLSKRAEADAQANPRWE
ncbi:MAG: toll/interleukin-1 receptor domain-containing protein [Planctomycetales bacterium]|nr:toll/interleukin-1 receptor domain-containing protein [Planctomycetales bacterium]